MREIKDLGAQLQKSQEEVDKSREEVSFHHFPVTEKSSFLVKDIFCKYSWFIQCVTGG